MPWLLSACAVPTVPAEIVYQDPTKYVRIEPDPKVRADEPETFNSHPASIAAEHWARILGGLRIRDHRLGIHAMVAGETAWQPVFVEEEIAVLAAQLSQALTQAGHDERVTFYLSRPHTALKREVTSGGLYVRGNRLHFVLSNHNVQYGVPAYGVVYDRRYPMRPTAPKWFDLTFEPREAVVEQQLGIVSFLLGREQDELIIDLGKLGLGLPVVRNTGTARAAETKRGRESLSFSPPGADKKGSGVFIVLPTWAAGLKT